MGATMSSGEMLLSLRGDACGAGGCAPAHAAYDTPCAHAPCAVPLGGVGGAAPRPQKRERPARGEPSGITWCRVLDVVPLTPRGDCSADGRRLPLPAARPAAASLALACAV
eukprot:7004205-Prymnesium_polylepis.1